jgi:serine/threonine protein kinase/Tol biopolymer transport system component
MNLKTGDSLGSYEILAPIGAGGMGEVYRARDARLGRDVAIKILPEAFARDEDRMRRFTQEARAVAALNHPNVLSVYDSGVENGVPYLVSELLEGESLRQRLDQGPIPARKTVEYAQQIADGLAAAHEKNIVHRDLKPENIYLTSGGRVKILDFGLAKLRSPDANGSGEGATATIAAVTNPGVVMGTAGYMAPEQVRGQAVDHRADIFSFGAVLYEMLSGERAFHKESSVETLNAILKEDPPQLDTEKLRVAPGLERIVHHCLEKKPADRFQSARDLTFALSSLSDTSTTQRPAVTAPERTSGRRWQALAAAVSAVLSAVVTYAVMRSSREVVRQDFAIAVSGEVSHLAISPDGKWLAFVSPGDTGLPRVYVQRIGSADVRLFAGTEGASYPFWSPDDAYVAYFANDKMQKIAIVGGEPQTITSVGSGPRGGSWGSKGVIIYARDSGGPLWRVNADGSNAMSLTDKLMRPDNTTHRWPAFLPDGDHFLMFTGNFGPAKDQATNGIILSSLSKVEEKHLISTNSSAGYSDGRIYYVDPEGALMAAKLDVSAGKLDGAPEPVASQVAESPSTFYGVFAVSSNATVVYSTNSKPSQTQFTWIDESGKELGRIGSPGVQANPSISPDGKRVAFDSEDFKANNVDVWVSDLERGASSRFTFEPTEEVLPVWSRDGSTIAYRNILPLAIHLKKANGLEPDRALPQVPNSADDVLPNSWAPGDREVLCSLQPAKGRYELMLAPLDGGKLHPLLNGSGNETNGQFSPDGKWVAYASDESGKSEIYVTTYPGAAGKWQVSRGGGAEPRWRGDGKAIFYIAPSQMLTEVDISPGDTFAAAAPHPLFQIHTRAPISSTDLFNYDVTPDGKRFLVNQYIKPDQPAPLRIVLHAGAAR